MAPPSITIRPPAPFTRTITIPGSKSLTNRALLLAALARGATTLRGALDSDDTVVMHRALGRLGAVIHQGPAEERRTIIGLGGAPRSLSDPLGPLHVGDAGTAARFLSAVVAASPLCAVLDGSPRMRERPMRELLIALRRQGAEIKDLGAPGHLPARICGPAAGLVGGEHRLARPPSSQFISALIFAAALARAPTRVVLEAGTPARPYVDMTLALLRRFGGRGAWLDPSVIHIEPCPLHAVDLDIEPDASSASYFLALAAIYGGDVTIPQLGAASLQGDARFIDVLAAMGAEVEQTATTTRARGRGPLRGVDLDLSAMPDMALTLAVTALHARGPTRIRGVGLLRHHESDRLAAAATELRRLGAVVVEHDDGLTIEPPERAMLAQHDARDREIRTYNDHRMAMAFSLAGQVAIQAPSCVDKTFPGYFDLLGQLDMVPR